MPIDGVVQSAAPGWVARRLLRMPTLEPGLGKAKSGSGSEQVLARASQRRRGCGQLKRYNSPQDARWLANEAEVTRAVNLQQ